MKNDFFKDLSPSYSFNKSLYYKSLFLKSQPKLYPQFRNANPEKQHVLEPVYIPGALNSGTCINCNDKQGDLFHSAGPHRNRR